MSLHFPNASRIHDAARERVTFWGHDSTFEIAVHVEGAALQALAPHVANDATAALQAFDQNRSSIQKAALASYHRRRASVIFLSATDFRT